MQFFDFFPPPKYLNPSQAGVSIDDGVIRFVSLNPLRYGEIKFAEGALIEALKKLKLQGFDFVNVAIPEEKSYIFNTKVESATYKDLADAVAFTVEENAPIKLASSVHAFEYLSNPEEGQSSTQVTVSVIPIEVAEAYAKDFGGAMVTPTSFDLRSEAIARALVKRGDERSHLIINLGDSKTGLYLVENEMVRFSSTITLDTASQGPETLNALKEEVKKVFLFSKDRRIDHITLTGTGAENDAFVANLLAQVETPYSIGNVWGNVRAFAEKLPEMPFGESLRYAAAIGASLPPSRHAYV